MIFRPAPWLPLHKSLGLEPPPPFDDRVLAEHVGLHAVNQPEAVALQFHDLGMNYRELDEFAAKLANAFKAQGIGKGDVVGIHLPNVPQYMIALVALSKIGAIGSGVSPLLAAPEIAYQVRDANIRAFLTLDVLAAGIISRLGEIPGCLNIVIVTGGADHLGKPCGDALAIAGVKTARYLDLLATAAAQCPQEAMSGDDTSMILYTGGTTGPPKGVMLSVRNVMYNPLQLVAYAPWTGASEVMMSAFPMFHVAGLAIHATCVRFGGRALLIPDPRDVAQICRQLQHFPPTRIAAVPTLYQMLVDTPAFRDVDFSGLKVALIGAAPLPAEDRRRIEEIIGKDKLCDVFGMTESSPIHLCNPPMRSKPTTVGIPVAGADTRIVDIETGTREMPFGEPGEIVTSGPQVMKGYLNLPDESARALRKLDGRTWLFTGDVGIMDEEGYITVCDRAKDMLIVGGYKVFSIEVEDKLKALACIAHSAVIGKPDTRRPGNDIVNLYVELTREAIARDPEAVRAEIIAFCRENMAAYKVPKNVFLIDQMPLTPVGKLDKKVLRAMHNNA